MSKLPTGPYKGVRDFYPEDQFIQNYILGIWKKTAQSFGYEEYSASVLEPTEIYTEKSGAEIVNEQTFTFLDRGQRSVTLRPEMTPTTARMVAHKRRELGFPLRWYAIPNLFRYEATQRGRLREHWQLNADILGVEGDEADLEIILVAYRVMKNFGASDKDFEILINYPSGEPKELEKFKDKLAEMGIANTRIDKTIKRGQAYYTGIVFEFFDTNKENSRSILGGGRYDNLTELFLPNGQEAMPAVGFGAGDVTMKDFLETHGLLPVYKTETKLYIASISDEYFSPIFQLAEKLRNSGVNVAVDWSGRKIGDQIKTADKHQIPYVIVIGEDEIMSKTYKLKDLKTGEEKSLTIDEIKACIT